MKTMTARYNSACSDCGGRISKGDTIRYSRATGATHADRLDCEAAAEADAERRYFDQVDRQYEIRGFYDDAEYARGYNDTRAAQMMGPAGSDAREAAYAAMEAQWAREGFDG